MRSNRFRENYVTYNSPSRKSDNSSHFTSKCKDVVGNEGVTEDYFGKVAKDPLLYTMVSHIKHLKTTDAVNILKDAFNQLLRNAICKTENVDRSQQDTKCEIMERLQSVTSKVDEMEQEIQDIESLRSKFDEKCQIIQCLEFENKKKEEEIKSLKDAMQTQMTTMSDDIIIMANEKEAIAAQLQKAINIMETLVNEKESITAELQKAISMKKTMDLEKENIAVELHIAINMMETMAKEKEYISAELDIAKNKKEAAETKMKSIFDDMMIIVKEKESIATDLKIGIEKMKVMSTENEVMAQRLEAMLDIVKDAHEAKEALSDHLSERDKIKRKVNVLRIKREPEQTNYNSKEEIDLIGPLKSEVLFLNQLNTENQQKIQSLKGLLPNVSIKEVSFEELAVLVEQFKTFLNATQICITGNLTVLKEEPVF